MRARESISQTDSAAMRAKNWANERGGGEATVRPDKKNGRNKKRRKTSPEAKVTKGGEGQADLVQGSDGGGAVNVMCECTEREGGSWPGVCASVSTNQGAHTRQQPPFERWHRQHTHGRSGTLGFNH